MIEIKDPYKILLSQKTNGKKLRIFCDLDGVICDWEKAATKTLGLYIDDPKVRALIKNGKRIEEFVGGDSVMWPLIDTEGEVWWENLELFPWSMKLVFELRRRTELFSFLTAPSNNPICAAGKVRFMKKHFGEKFKDFLIGKNKHLCAASNTFLVDDDKRKVDRFREHGGHAYLWPQALKLLDGDIDIEETFKEMFTYIDELGEKLK